jgi:hypothetical protein
MTTRKLEARGYSYESPELEVLELPDAVHLAVITKAPEKYLLVDLESGQMYKGSNESNQHLPGYKLWKLIK